MSCVVIVIFLFCHISLYAFVCVFSLYCIVYTSHAVNKGYLLTYLLSAVYVHQGVKVKELEEEEEEAVDNKVDRGKNNFS